MSGTSSIPYGYQNSNPLLYTFRDYHTGIQPYFIIVSQFFIFEFSLRFWDKAVYGTWLLPGEVIIVERAKNPPIGRLHPISQLPPTTSTQITQNSFTASTVFIFQEFKKLSLKTKNTEKLPTFDLYDVVYSALALLAHAIWYCYIQSNCMSGQYATIWNCYNLFGYRVYNYLFSPFTSLAFNFISKLIILREHGIDKLLHRKQKWRKTLAMIIFYPSLVLSAITFVFVGALILPYLFTNAIPMMIIYAFIAMTYAYIVTLITLAIQSYTVITGHVFSFEGDNLGFFKRQMKKYHYNPQLVIQAGLRLFPYLMTILFNLSQYFYYGGSFLGSLTSEADSRDPTLYFGRVSNSSIIAHTILIELISSEIVPPGDLYGEGRFGQISIGCIYSYNRVIIRHLTKVSTMSRSLFNQESQVLCSIDHPNLANILYKTLDGLTM
ncbi:unnamed protein product, partial [Adineta steineri]